MSGLRKYIPINSVAASAADLAVASDGNVVITGDSGFHRPNVNSINVLRYRPSVAEGKRVAATASPAANTTYSFYIEQDLRDTNDVTVPTRVLISYTTVAAPSASAFGNALTAIVNGKIADSGLSLTAAAYTSGNGGVELTGSATNSTFKVSQLKNLTLSSLLNSGTAGSAASTSGLLVTVPVASTADIVVGGQVKISGWSGGGTINGVAAASEVTLPVKTVTTNTSFVLIAESVSGTVNGTPTYETIAQDERGAGAYYIAKNITSGGSPTAVSVSSSGKYHEVIVSGAAPSGQSQLTQDFAPFETHFLIESTDSDANDLLDRIVEVKNYLDASGNFDPLLLL